MRVHGLAMLLFFCAGSYAAAGGINSGEPDDHYGLGRLRTFSGEPEAKVTCGDDAVVWAERYAGFFYLPDEEQYARAPSGAYACRADAKTAHYWGTSLFESLSEYKGKEMKWEYPGY